MATWYYYDESGERVGPVDDQQIRTLAFQGIIVPETRMEMDTGKNGLARHIPGLFSNNGTQNINLARQNGSGQYQGGAAPMNYPMENRGQNGPNAYSPEGGNSTYCTNCGASVMPNAIACMKCGASPVGHRKFCHTCGTSLNPEQIVCIRCGTGIALQEAGYGQGYPPGQGYSAGQGYRPNRVVSTTPRSRLTAALLAIFLGHLGVHKFYMGSWGWGLVYIGAILLTFFIGWFATSITGIVEGIIYLKMTDEEFAAKYPNETIAPFRW